MTRLFISFILLCGAFGASAGAAAGTNAATPQRLLAELEQALGGTTSVQTDFVQEKQLALLQQKVFIKGHLVVEQPARFAWHVSSPIRYSMVIDGTTLRQWDETTDKIQKLSLAANPVFEVVTRQLRAWFGGQLESLTKDFETAPDPVLPRTVIFTPRAASMARKAIRQVRLTFREDRRYLQEIFIEEQGGDTTRMTFSETRLNVAIPPDAWEVKPHAR